MGIMEHRDSRIDWSYVGIYRCQGSHSGSSLGG